MTAKRKRRASNSFPFYLLIPAFLLLGIFVFYPVARVFGYSTWHYTALRPKETAFVGLGNFATILQYDLFYLSLKNSMIYAATTTVVQFLLGLWLALLLRHMKTGSGLYRTLVFARGHCRAYLHQLFGRWCLTAVSAYSTTFCCGLV